MGPRVNQISSDDSIPAQAPVVIIGGGIVGISTAFYLAARRIPAVVCEKGEIGAEQSSRNWGWIRKQGGDPSEIPLAIESWRLWDGMNAMIGRETGYARCGSLSLAASEQDTAIFEGWLESAHAFVNELGTRILTRQELEKLLPGASPHYASGLYTETDSRAEPGLAAPAIAEGARSLGARILTQCAVRGLEFAKGRVSAVVTEKGRIACDSVVLAGGAWCRLFCENLGIRLPQLKLRTSVMSTEPLQQGPAVAALEADFSFRRRLDGGYTVGTGFMNYVDVVPDSFRFLSDFLPTLRHEWHTLRVRIGGRFVEEWGTPRRWTLDEPSPFEKCRVLDPIPVQADLDAVQAALCKKFPVFQGIRIQEKWAGMIDVSPDAIPILSAVPALGGFFVATGFSGHGFGSGPGAGRLMADLVSGATPLVDPKPFRFTRFTDRPRPEYRPRV